MVRSAPSTSLSMTFSVTSSSSRRASRRARRRASRTCQTISPVMNCAGDTFTETITSPGQLAAVAQASRSTQLPICTIRSLSSARPMNSSGPISPRCGWFQRINASAEAIVCSCARKRGW